VASADFANRYANRAYADPDPHPDHHEHANFEPDSNPDFNANPHPNKNANSHPDRNPDVFTE